MVLSPPQGNSSSSSSSSLNLLDRYKYRVYGPTCVHLKYEFYLLVCMVLFTASNLLTLYSSGSSNKSNYDVGGGLLPGDYYYILLVTVWLSRYLVFRWLCLWDPTTLRSPTLIGIVSNVLSSHLSAGQTFDRPTQQILAKYVGSPAGAIGGGGGGAGFGGSGGGGGGGQQQGRTAANISFSQLLPNSELYAMQWLKIWIIHPILDTLEAVFTSFSSKSSSSRGGGGGGGAGWTYSFWTQATVATGRTGVALRMSLNTITQYCYTLWLSYGPTFPFLLPVATLAFYSTRLGYMMFVEDDHGPPSTITSINKVRAENSPKDNDNAASSFNTPYGAYQRFVRPEWSEVFFCMTVLGCLLSLIYYFRLILPVTDQVAGSNVIKDLRAREASRGGSGAGGGASGRSSRGGSRGSSTLYQKENQDAPWPERMRPITTENRFRLAFDVRIIRMFENIFLCGIMPRTAYICRATNHCPLGAQLFDLTRILYPAGVASPLRKDGIALSSSGSVNSKVTWWLVVSIAIVTLVLLLAHTVMLNKTYLAIMSYISTEWDPVTPQPTDISKNTPPPVWDPKRRYKAGSVVLYPPSGPKQTVYRATTNSPEGKPPNTPVTSDSTYGYLQLRHEQVLMKKELGHPSTSSILFKVSILQTGIAGLHILLYLFAALVYGFSSLYGLLMAVIAHIIASYALVSTGLTNYEQMQQLNSEICQGVAA